MTKYISRNNQTFFRVFNLALLLLVSLPVWGATPVFADSIGFPQISTTAEKIIAQPGYIHNLVMAADNQTGRQGTGYSSHPIMQPSPEMLLEWEQQYRSAAKASTKRSQQLELEAASYPASIDLRNHLLWNSNNMAQRQQSACGNCWVWAGTGALEVALSTQKNVRDRFSIRYLNSNYNGPFWASHACCGGTPSNFTNFYADRGRIIPWNNNNAKWDIGFDGGCKCECANTFDPASIATIPYYPITSIQAKQIETTFILTDVAIDRIKEQLNNGKAVYFGFFLPNTSAWDDFNNFWDCIGEYTADSKWQPDKWCAYPYLRTGGGHAVLCVGYHDEEGTANDYWLLLNSWGTTYKRPNGLFRMAMHMNYDCWYPLIPITAFEWWTIEPVYGSATPIVQTLDAENIQYTSAVLKANLKFTGTAPVSLAFVYGETASCSDGQTSAQTLSQADNYTIPLTGLSPGKRYFYQAVAVGNGIANGEVKSFITPIMAGPAAPEPLQPANGSWPASSSLTFTWKASSTAYDYELLVWSTAGTYIHNGWVGNNVTKTVYGFPLDGTEYNWKVRARNAGSEGPYSQVWSFRSGLPPAMPAPSLVSPGKSQSVAGSSITFTWTPVAGAVDYSLIVWNAGNATTFFYGWVGNNTSKSLSGFPNNSTGFNWQVSAKNGAGSQSWSEQWYFKNQPEPPSAPTLVSPKNSEKIPGTLITFTWNAVPNATGYYLDVINATTNVIWSFSTAGTSYPISGDFKSDGAIYNWKVKAKIYGSEGPYSETWSLANTLPVSIVTSSLPPGAIGSYYSNQLQATDGTGVYTWTIPAGSLPPGLALNPSTGEISGPPGSAGTLSFTVRVTDTSSASFDKNLSITIIDPLAIVTSTLPYGTVGQSYPTTTLEARGGKLPYTWSISSGSLPQDLSLDPSQGIISGIPQTDGTFAITFMVTDGKSNTATRLIYLTVSNPLSITTTTLPNGVVGSSYSASLKASGGIGNYTWSRTSGTWPPGLNEITNEGIISGVPTAVGNYIFTVIVNDDASHSKSKELSIKVIIATPPAPMLSSPNNGATVTGTSVTFKWTASAGATNYLLQVRKVSDNTIFINKWVGNVTSSTQGGFPANGTQYRWQVVAHNSAGNSPWTGYRTFTNNVAASPVKPTLSSPNDGATITGASVTFKWTASAGATNYLLQVRKVSDNTIFINKWVGKVISSTQGGFPANGTQYRWRVIAHNSAGNSPWTAYRTFTNSGTANPLLTLPASSYEPDGSFANYCRLNSITLNGSSQSISVSPGALISGSANFDLNGPESGTRMQGILIYSWTPSWPPPEGYYETLYDDGPGTGWTNHVSSFTLNAPSTPGTYYLWFVGGQHYSAAQLVLEFNTTLPLPAHARIIVQ